MTFEDIHYNVLSESSDEWKKYIKSIPLILLKVYYEAGRSVRHEKADRRLLRQRTKKIIPFESERMVFTYPPVAKIETKNN